MSIRAIRRILLYVAGAFFLAFGLVGLFAPAMLILALHLRPETLAGLGELRALYGGGFMAFGLLFLAGLHSRRFGPGLLMAMCIILAGIVIGRLFSIIFDHDLAFAGPNAIFESIMAICCYYEAQSTQVRT